LKSCPAQYSYVNTVPVEEEVPYPGDRLLERRIKSLIRWNAMAMVHRQNKKDPGIGGHISTYSSLATLLEVASITSSTRVMAISRAISLLSGPFFAGSLRSGVSGRTSQRRASKELPPRIARRAGIAVVSASLAAA